MQMFNNSNELQLSVPRFVLAGGGSAGREAAKLLHAKFAKSFAGLIWMQKAAIRRRRPNFL